ncbi:MAG: UDP-N-acetylmuramate dehydrogenase [Candidatus Omnitrophica bacterium]|nr:UDP-N-acetylmuramate dehydrogenase [Candidatus Omnitrophota bacterium]
MSWWKRLKGKIKFFEPLAKHTTFKIGGKAEYFIEPKDTLDLKLILRYAKKYKKPIYLLGAGSNILVKDTDMKGIVVHLNSSFFKRVSFKDNLLEAGCGVKLNRIINEAYKRGLSGLEFLAGVPGTLGGALMMNAGAFGKSIGELVEEVKVMDYNGNEKRLTLRDLKIGYRRLGLKDCVILTACLRLNKKNKIKIKQTLVRYLKKRIATQEMLLPSAGCVFKNPSGKRSAGELIDLCGLKGKRIGDAFVSLKHANFIVNLGRAKAKDVLGLMHLIRRKVKKRFKIDLEPEIKIWK